MRTALYSALSMSLLATSAFAADTSVPLKKQYNEPTRGFFIEHGTVSKQGQVSVELNSKSDNIESGGGIRLGLPQAELIISSDNVANSALLKWAMKDFHTNNNSSSPIHWALIGGISQFDVENGEHQTHFALGAAATVAADAGTFTLGTQLVHTNNKDQDSDTFVNVDLGAYVGVIDTSSGLFSLGIEAILTTQDDKDNQFAFGGRWAYNERVNIDIIPVILSDSDLTGLPGLVRLNVVF